MQSQAICNEQPFLRNPVPGYGFECIQSIIPDRKVLSTFTCDELYSDLSHSGVIIYQGFSDSLNDFDELVSICSSKVTFDPARLSATSNTAEINAGIYEMGLHRENGNLPFHPDIQWFFCLEPAAIGSQTTMCDGQRVFFDLSPKTRNQFINRKIKYSRRIPWDNVKRFLSIELQLESISDEHMHQVMQDIPGQKYHRLDKNLIYSELVISALEVSRFSNKRSFCNSLLGPSFNYDPPHITWEDGEEIPFYIWDEVKDVTSRYTYKHFWRRGDIVVIDNTRVMHGRCRLEDTNRRIFGAQSYKAGGSI